MNQEKEKSQIIVIVSAGDRKGRPYKRKELAMTERCYPA